MRSIIATLALFAMALSGCTHVAKDLRHPGGAVGGVLDRRMFDASRSKQLVLLRYAILSAMVARGGTVYSRDKRESDAYVDYLVNTAEEMNILAGHIYGYGAPTDGPRLACELEHANTKSPAVPSFFQAKPPETNSGGAGGDDQADTRPPESPDPYGCLTYKVNFESDLPMMEKRLFRLAMAALPQKEAKRFLDFVTKGDIVGGVIAAFGFTAKSLDGLHSGAAVHRTGLEISALQFIDGDEPWVAGRTDDKCVEKLPKLTVFEASACMGLPTDRLWVGKHDQRGDYFAEVNPQIFEAIMRNIRDSCRMIPLGLEEDEDSLIQTRENRVKDCDKITFVPRARWQTDEQITANRSLFQAAWKKQAETSAGSASSD